MIEIAFVETSALSGENVEKAFKSLVTEIYKISKTQMQTQHTTNVVAGKTYSNQAGVSSYADGVETSMSKIKMSKSLKLSRVGHAQEPPKAKKKKGCC